MRSFIHNQVLYFEISIRKKQETNEAALTDFHFDFDFNTEKSCVSAT